MNALCIVRQTRLHAVVVLTAAIAIVAGCNDTATTNSAPTINPRANQRPQVASSTAEPGAREPNADQSAANSTPDPANSGTGEQPSESPVAGSTEPSPQASQVESPKLVSPTPLAPKESLALPAAKPDEIYEPKVILSQSHEQTCLVRVGDVLPNLALQTLTGEPVALDDLRGEKLTVVVFWTNQLAMSREQVGRLVTEVAMPFRHLGVKVVAVNVGDPIEQIELEDSTKKEVTCLVDSDGTATAKVATEKLPRTYLLDSEGRILWFDIEYSRSTRRQLKNAIFFHSPDQSAAAS